MIALLLEQQIIGKGIFLFLCLHLISVFIYFSNSYQKSAVMKIYVAIQDVHGLYFSSFYILEMLSSFEITNIHLLGKQNHVPATQ